MAAGNILIVEDDRLVAEDLELALTGFGYRITGTSASAADAIRQIEEQRPDLVLMDIQLRGEGDGITAADWICQHQDIPVIYLSAYADEATLQRAKDTLPYGFIVKPFQARQLRSSIEVALSRHKSEKEARKEEATSAIQSSLQAISSELKEIKGRMHGADFHLQKLVTQYGLTHREGETLRLFMTDQRVENIAPTLAVSPSTVRTHLTSIFRKLGVHSQAELIQHIKQWRGGMDNG